MVLRELIHLSKGGTHLTMDTTAYDPEQEGVDPLGEQPSSAFPVVPEGSSPHGAPWFTVDNTASGAISFNQTQIAGDGVSPSQTQFRAGGPSPVPRSVPISTARRRKLPGIRLIAICVLLVLFLIVGGISVFASTAPTMFMGNPSSTRPQQSTHQDGQTHPPTPMLSKSPTTPPTKKTPQPSPSPVNQTSTWLPNSLPASCNAAGVSVAQSVGANNEAVQFTLREESLSYQQIDGLQASTALMTHQTKVLRFPNDRRSTAVFTQQVKNRQLIQMPSNLQPQVLQCQSQSTQGQTFIWVSVSFLLSVSKIDAPNPMMQPDTDPQTKKYIIHQMSVLLVQVPQGTPNPPLWLGWSVVDYALDNGKNIPNIPPPGQV